MAVRKVMPPQILKQIEAWGYADKLEEEILPLGTSSGYPGDGIYHIHIGWRALCGAGSPPPLRSRVVKTTDILQRKRRCMKCTRALASGYEATDAWRNEAGVLRLAGTYLTLEGLVALTCEQLRSGDPTGIRMAFAEIKDLVPRIRPVELWDGLGDKVIAACEALWGALEEARSAFAHPADESMSLVVWRQGSTIITDRDIKVERSRKMVTRRTAPSFEDQARLLDILHATSKEAVCGRLNILYAVLPTAVAEEAKESELPLYRIHNVPLEGPLDPAVLETLLGLYQVQGEGTFADLTKAYQAALDVHR